MTKGPEIKNKDYIIMKDYRKTKKVNPDHIVTNKLDTTGIEEVLSYKINLWEI